MILIIGILNKFKDLKLTNETVSTINLFTGSDIKLNEEEEVTDVCRAIEEIKKEAAEEAVAEMCIAIEEIKKEAAEEAVAKIKITNVENIMESIHVSVEEACRMLKYSVKDYENAKKKFAI